MEDLSRDFPAAYEDKFDVPSGTCTMQERISKTCRFPDEMNGHGSNRPSPRNISNVLFHQVRLVPGGYVRPKTRFFLYKSIRSLIFRHSKTPFKLQGQFVRRVNKVVHSIKFVCFLSAG